MKFKIDSKIFDKFPDLVIGVIICKHLDNSGKVEEIQKGLREQEKMAREKYNTESLSQNPKIDVWRKAYSSFGAKSKESKSSVENLYRMVIQGINLRPINKLVDIYNLLSLKYMVPIGGEDIEKIKGDVILTFAGSNEPPVLLLGDKDPRPPHLGEIIYKDDISAICRRWNWRESDRTKFTENTKNCFLVIEGLSPVTEKDIETATQELTKSIQKFCNGNVSYKILNKTNPEIDLA